MVQLLRATITQDRDIYAGDNKHAAASPSCSLQAVCTRQNTHGKLILANADWSQLLRGQRNPGKLLFPPDNLIGVLALSRLWSTGCTRPAMLLLFWHLRACQLCVPLRLYCPWQTSCSRSRRVNSAQCCTVGFWWEFSLGINLAPALVFQRWVHYLVQECTHGANEPWVSAPVLQRSWIADRTLPLQVGLQSKTTICFSRPAVWWELLWGGPAQFASLGSPSKNLMNIWSLQLPFLCKTVTESRVLGETCFFGKQPRVERAVPFWKTPVKLRNFLCSVVLKTHQCLCERILVETRNFEHEKQANYHWTFMVCAVNLRAIKPTKLGRGYCMKKIPLESPWPLSSCSHQSGKILSHIWMTSCTCWTVTFFSLCICCSQISTAG